MGRYLISNTHPTTQKQTNTNTPSYSTHTPHTSTYTHTYTHTCTNTHTHTTIIITASIAGLIMGAQRGHCDAPEGLENLSHTDSNFHLRLLAQHTRPLAQNTRMLAQHARLFVTCLGCDDRDAPDGPKNAAHASSSLARRQLDLLVRWRVQCVRLLVTCLVLAGAGMRGQGHRGAGGAVGELRVYARGLKSRHGCVFVVRGFKCCDFAPRRVGCGASICVAHLVLSHARPAR